jgi:hypothetical protein
MQNKNKFRRIFRRIQQQNKTKTSSAGFLSGVIPADPATKTKQKQVPPDIPADPATKTKQKQVPPDVALIPAELPIPAETNVWLQKHSG